MVGAQGWLFEPFWHYWTDTMFLSPNLQVLPVSWVQFFWEENTSALAAPTPPPGQKAFSHLD